MLTLVIIGAVVLLCDVVWIARYARKSDQRAVEESDGSRGFGGTLGVVVLLGANVLYVLGLGIHIAGEGVTSPGSTGMGPSDHVSAASGEVRDPLQHLPLAGMEGFTGGRQAACDRLRGFLSNMSEALIRAHRQPPMIYLDIELLSEQSQCTMGEAAVQAAIAGFRDAYAQAGMEPLPPFALLGQALPGPAALEMDMNHIEMVRKRCGELSRLFDHWSRQLKAAGHGVPLTEAQHQAMISGRCTLREPSVKVGLQLYRDAYRRAGLLLPNELSLIQSRP